MDEKLRTSAANTRGGFAAGPYQSILDPRTGGAAASLLEDLPVDDLAALQVGSTAGALVLHMGSTAALKTAAQQHCVVYMHFERLTEGACPFVLAWPGPHALCAVLACKQRVLFPMDK